MTGLAGTVATLAGHRHDLAVYCDACNARSGILVRFEELLERHGPEYKLERWRRRLRCTGCGARGAASVRVSQRDIPSPA